MISTATIRFRIGWGRIARSVALLTALANCPSLRSQTYATQIGVEAGPDRATSFMDAFKDQGRLFLTPDQSTAPTDANGWPTTDGIVVVFDNRPVPAWAPPIDDPAQDQPNSSGTYTVSFNGAATLYSLAGFPTVIFNNQSYDPATNTTTVNVFLPGGPTYADGLALMGIGFENTRRSGPSDPTPGDGITNLQVIRPGFTLAQAATQVFDPAFVNALAPFSYLRFMNWLGTNTFPFYVAGPTPLITWAQRSLPTDEFQGVGPNISSYPSRAGAWGISWEYVIVLANATNKDIWINVPISATGGSDPLDPTYVAAPDSSSYVYNLALLLKNGNAFTGNRGLNPGLHIYLEHSNEVWNSSFGQNGWNENAANDEVALGSLVLGSVLNNDGSTDPNAWAARRDIKRLYEIAQIFQSVFGAGSLNTTIRPVYAWFQIEEGPGSYAANALAWFQNTYGSPGNYFYAMAQGDYFSNANYYSDATIDQVLQDMQTGSQGSVSDIAYVQQNLATAQQYGLPLFTYEGGPSNNDGGTNDTTNIGVQIQANRQYAATDDLGLGMDLLVENHIRNNWFEYGGSNFGYFQLSSAYSRYGSWGLTDDYCNLSTAKYSAILNLTGYTPSPPSVPENLVATAGQQSAILTWQSVTAAANYTVERSQNSGGPYTTLGTACTPGYTDIAVTGGTTYYYVVTAVNTAGQSSAPSNEGNATPASTPVASAMTANVGTTPQSAEIDAVFSNALAVTVQDAASNPVSGVSVTFTAPASGASGLFSNSTPAITVATNNFGIASAAFRANAMAGGPYNVTAAASGLTTVNFSLTNTAATLPAPTLVSPLNGAIDVLLAASLNWDPAAGATSYDVYFGTSSPPSFVANTTATTYSLGTLAEATTYYWSIVASNSSGTGPSATWSFTTQGPGLEFYPITPCRLVDTRGATAGFNGIAPFSGPSLPGGQTLTIPVQSAAEAGANTTPAPCGVIPLSAQAYAINITVVPYAMGAVDYISLWPAGSPQPAVATLNDPQGLIVANAAIVPAGSPSGGISIYNAGPATTDVVIDMNGYFAPPTAGTSLQFYPVAPCRLVDTRGAAAGFDGIDPFAGPPIPPAGTATIPVQSTTEASTITEPAPCGAIPSSAQAYSFNLTVVPVAQGRVDYVSLWPAGSPQTVVATLNDPQGAIVANAALVPAGAPNGGVSVYNDGSSATDVVIDMNGYFAAPTGLQFYPIAPCRLVDTRGVAAGFDGIAPFSGPSIPPLGTLTIPVQSATEAGANTEPAPCGVIPSSAQAYSMNITVVPPAKGDPVDFVTLWPAGLTQPFVATLNDPQGLIVANAAIVQAGLPSGGISVYNAGPSPTDVVIDMNGYFAAP
jgi:fibronectin type 3 domain-containing protein